MWLLWIILIVIVIYMFRDFTPSGRDSAATSLPESALDILKERYARGEIDEAEYERRKKELEKE